MIPLKMSGQGAGLSPITHHTLSLGLIWHPGCSARLALPGLDTTVVDTVGCILTIIDGASA